MESALEGDSGVATSREEAKWGGFSEVATGFRPHRAFRVSRPVQDEEAGSLAAFYPPSPLRPLSGYSRDMPREMELFKYQRIT